MSLGLTAGCCLVGALLLLPISALAQSSPPIALATELATANHILVEEGIIDVRGHVSVRDPDHHDYFWISRAIAPALVTAADLQEFDLDGRQVGGASGTAYTERFIHARIYKARPDVKSVVHAHTPSLITLSDSDIPIRPLTTAALFAGDGVPVFVNGPVGEGIHDSEVGDRLAKALGQSGALLMRGHGMVVVGSSIETAVGRSVGLATNAQMMIELLSMHVQPVYLTPPPGIAAAPQDYAREWSWWAAKVAK
jgi:HCOMODA/2-hydroxy-3-carboxy-muconic semialdehyde decarboxylase